MKNVIENILKHKSMKFVYPVITVIAIILAGYFYMQNVSLKENPQEAAKKETAEVMAKVGKLMVLPLGETPTLATVSDPEALKDQVFFALAQKGDKVLIYSQSKKAILYSVELNKIIDVAPLNVGTQKPTTPAPTIETPAPTTTNTTPTKTPAKTTTKK